ncbi:MULTISPECIES: IS1380 family transposase [Pseudonocardia]|uniref:IS1380 family transposase n=1 Tax=Pseudonocardia TaxID=1847 RepID=UPI000F7B1341|nr:MULTISPECIES: IS1380 family transposase [Pseudonocardia]TDN71833.1 DDE family transposase [Pseudonocardia autotrophica]TDN72013.1 DDE family transposase [Pseudonocardia autotrophica]TDN73034.1 DDE family transposase [Pseudonocardia autotrophica]TDN74712.1 DDE family transposase [Pseudonocardia autotrophica]
MQASHALDRIQVSADDESLINDAGLLLPATLGQRLGLPGLLDSRVTAGANAGDKCLSVIHSALAGGDCIDDVNALRAGATETVLGHRAVAASTVGTFLRSMSWGHARQLDAVARAVLARAAGLGAVETTPPDDAAVVVDIDATLVETYGLDKSGARQVMRTGRRGYHPLLAVMAGTGDVLHARLRRGRTNDSSGAGSFLAETLSRVRAAGAGGPVVVRADTGFYLADVLTACRRHRAGFSVGARMIGRMRATIAAIDESQWTPVPYFEPGAAVTELGWRVFDRDHRRRDGLPGRHRGAGVWVRLIVRRTPTPPAIRDRRAAAGQLELFPGYDYHPFITDQSGDPVELDRFHRAHAEVELAIRDLKHGLALSHLPSKRFGANQAWLVLQTLAHNLGRWSARLAGLAATPRQTIKTLRRRYLRVAARLSSHARRHQLRLPAHWPWVHAFIAGLHRLRALPGPAG